MSRKQVVISTLAAALTVFTAAVFYVSWSSDASDTASVSPEIANALVRPHSPTFGPDDAPVTIVEFFDPACETCRAFHPIVKDIMFEHGDAVRVVIRYTPFHGEVSVLAIRLLEAARMQGKFETVLERILGAQPLWASHGRMQPDNLMLIVEDAGLDMVKARTQMQSPEVVAVINQDIADVETVGVQKTPTFFVNGKPLEQFGEAQLRALVAAEVRATGS